MMREAILRVLADHAERSITDVLDALPPSADLALVPPPMRTHGRRRWASRS